MTTRSKASDGNLGAALVDPKADVLAQALFPTSPTSPFPDKYDIEGERAALKDLIEADEPDPTDPRYPRYLTFEEREESLRQLQSAHRQRNGADREVPDGEARRLTDLRGLVDEEQDVMDLHTLEAARLFIGRAIEPGKKGFGQAGGKKVAAALRYVWYLSANDNPYADLCLVRTSERLAEVRQLLEAATARFLDKLEKLRQRGLRLSVLRAPTPMSVNLGFRSPYGYSVAQLLVDFDLWVRIVKTLARKDLLTKDEERAEIYAMLHQLRSIFEQAVYFQRYLARDELKPLSRADWLPGADEEAKKRVAAVSAIFGELPREVFTAAKRPPHSRRRIDLSPQELRLLAEVPLTAEPAAAVALV